MTSEACRLPWRSTPPSFAGAVSSMGFGVTASAGILKCQLFVDVAAGCWWRRKPVKLACRRRRAGSRAPALPGPAKVIVRRHDERYARPTGYGRWCTNGSSTRPHALDRKVSAISVAIISLKAPVERTSAGRAGSIMTDHAIADCAAVRCGKTHRRAPLVKSPLQQAAEDVNVAAQQMYQWRS